MSSKKQFTTEQAREIGHKLNIDWSRFDVEQFSSNSTDVPSSACSPPFGMRPSSFAALIKTSIAAICSRNCGG